jgi:hypothetical protein
MSDAGTPAARTTGDNMVDVDWQAIRALGGTIEQKVGADLDAAAEKFAETRVIEHSNFTAVAPWLATAYVGAVEFTEEQLKTDRDHLGEMRTTLEKTAANWEAVEERNTTQFR